MENTTKKEHSQSRMKKVVIGTLGVAAGICGGFLLFKFREPIKQNLTCLFSKGSASSLPLAQAERHSTNLVKEISKQGLPEIVEPVKSAVVNNSEKPILNGGQPFFVSGGLRNLPSTRNASPEKRALAEALGITLLDHQTLVNDYMKNKCCA